MIYKHFSNQSCIFSGPPYISIVMCTSQRQLLNLSRR